MGMASRQRTIQIPFGLAAIIPVVFTIIGINVYFKSRTYEKGYAQIKTGDSEGSVVSIMGKPDQVDVCRTVSSSHDDEEDRSYQEHCVKQYRYNTFLKPYVISFDSQNRVLVKGYQTSP